ncbi:hypothetical protein Btru_058723 [Bulinus truncatus]|nr:hypothetical protein Btru_058723 [Bulinus truncatus]
MNRSNPYHPRGCHKPQNNAARERSRVKTLRSAFLELQRSLPAVPPNTKLSKLDVLVLATTYIYHLTKTLERQEHIDHENMGTTGASGTALTRNPSCLLGHHRVQQNGGPIVCRQITCRPSRRYPVCYSVHAPGIDSTDGVKVSIPNPDCCGGHVQKMTADRNLVVKQSYGHQLDYPVLTGSINSHRESWKSVNHDGHTRGRICNGAIEILRPVKVNKILLISETVLTQKCQD